MAKVTPDWSVPNVINDFTSDINTIRNDNQVITLMSTIKSNDFAFPQWSSSWNGNDKSKPDSVVCTHNSDGTKMRFSFTWDVSDKVTQEVWEFDRGLGDGYEIVDDGTITRAYNASDEPTGSTST